MRKQLFTSLVTLGLAVSALSSQADVFNMGAGLTSLETVLIADAGNAADERYASHLGAVDYSYRMGTCEVTAAQYADFLNHKAKSDPYGLYNTWMSNDPYGYACKIMRSGSDGSYTYSVASEWANRPVNYVDFWDACRFANWLSNGQGDGDTETGAYTLDGYVDADGHTIGRDPGATWVIPNEDEWYKAAYYKGGMNGGYWEYATQSNVQPSNIVGETDPGNNANYRTDNWSIGSPYYRTNVGEFENSESSYGTFDQSGNLYEWSETAFPGHADNFFRAIRGGAFNSVAGSLAASATGGAEASWYDGNIGFRVAYIEPVPEPSSLLSLLTGIGAIGLLRKRKVTRTAR